MIAPKNETTAKELIPEGNHLATLFEIMYLGTITTPYRVNPDDPNSDFKKQYKVRLTFELPNELRTFKEGEPEKPLVISKECTFSLYKGTQTALLRTITHALLGVSLRDEEAEVFDIDQLLGKSCMVEISHEEYKENKYASPVGFGSVPKGMNLPEQVNESRIKSVDKMTEDKIEELPEFIRKKMQSSDEWKARFDPSEIARKKEIKEQVESMKPKSSEDDGEIKPEDIPF